MSAWRCARTSALRFPVRCAAGLLIRQLLLQLRGVALRCFPRLTIRRSLAFTRRLRETRPFELQSGHELGRLRLPREIKRAAADHLRAIREVVANVAVRRPF